MERCVIWILKAPLLALREVIQREVDVAGRDRARGGRWFVSTSIV